MSDRTTHGLAPFLPPDLPPEVQPTPWEEKPVSLLDLTEFRADKLAQEGIRNFQDLGDFLAAGGDLKDISHIGPTWEEKITNKFNQYREERVPEQYRGG